MFEECLPGFHTCGEPEGSPAVSLNHFFSFEWQFGWLVGPCPLRNVHEELHWPYFVLSSRVGDNDRCLFTRILPSQACVLVWSKLMSSFANLFKTIQHNSALSYVEYTYRSYIQYTIAIKYFAGTFDCMCPSSICTCSIICPDAVHTRTITYFWWSDWRSPLHNSQWGPALCVYGNWPASQTAAGQLIWQQQTQSRRRSEFVPKLVICAVFNSKS